MPTRNTGEDLAHRYGNHRPLEAEQWRQDGDEQPRVEAERDDLKDAVERDQRRRVLAVAARELDSR